MRTRLVPAALIAGTMKGSRSCLRPSSRRCGSTGELAPSGREEGKGRPAWVPADCVVAGTPHWAPPPPGDRPSALPTRDEADGTLIFPSHPEFRPNQTPPQVLRAGAFGGTYYRPIHSRVAKQRYLEGSQLEFPPEWFAGLDCGRMVSSPVYSAKVNKYGVKSGNGLDFWEDKGWMRKQDPYGWFQWYCRFYLGRRSEDDDRQISRWVRAIGPKGRWRTFLVGQCVKSGKGWDDATASPVTRQTLLHWGYELSEAEFDRLAPPIRGGKSVIYLGRVSGPKGEASGAGGKGKRKR